MNFDALVLSPWMTAHKLYPWHRSITAALSGTVDVLEEYDETVSAPSITLQIPAVLRLRKHLARSKTNPKFSRHHVYMHYGFRCQYCGNVFLARKLTYDHVIPRSKGGLTNWKNIVPACFTCNGRKGNRTPEEAGMRLLCKPSRPDSLPITGLIALPKHVPELWLPYLPAPLALVG